MGLRCDEIGSSPYAILAAVRTWGIRVVCDAWDMTAALHSGGASEAVDLLNKRWRVGVSADAISHEPVRTGRLAACVRRNAQRVRGLVRGIFYCRRSPPSRSVPATKRPDRRRKA